MITKYDKLKKGIDFKILPEPTDILPNQIWYGHCKADDSIYDKSENYFLKVIGDDGISVVYTEKLSKIGKPDYGPNYLVQDFCNYFKLTDL